MLIRKTFSATELREHRHSVDIMDRLHKIREDLGFENYKRGELTRCELFTTAGIEFIWSTDVCTPEYYIKGL